MASATFVTSRGTFTAELYEDQAPETVRNFVALARGEREWSDPDAGRRTEALYPGTIFHRVIPNFMIQGGDPQGTGFGGPGYTFEDEFPDDGATFAEPGMLAMANAGPNTNGSQFFLTVAPTPWLQGKHTIFGKVTSGMDIVEDISNVATDARDKPLEPVVIERIDISD